MRRLHDDGDAHGRDFRVDRFGNLVGQALLHLQPPREHLDEPRDLAQPDHPGARDVRHVTFAEKRQQMVLAQAVEIDILDDHHLAIIDREQRVVQYLIDVGAVSTGQKPVRLLDAPGRVEQPLAGRILAHLGEQTPDQLLHRSILYLDCGRSVGAIGRCAVCQSARS